MKVQLSQRNHCPDSGITLNSKRLRERGSEAGSGSHIPEHLINDKVYQQQSVSHIVHTPLITFRNDTSFSVFTFKELLLKPITSICRRKKLRPVAAENVKTERTNTIPSVARSNTETIRRRRRASIFGSSRTLNLFFLCAQQKFRPTRRHWPVNAPSRKQLLGHSKAP